MRARDLCCPILVITDAQSESELSRLFDAGVSDFLPLPLRQWEVLARLAHWSRMAFGIDSAPAAPVGELGLEQIKGESPALQVQIGMARRFANCDGTVLITGETGTGKEIFARGIHHSSLRSSKPFIPVNCGALPVELIENELFGHEAGAFTGARHAHGGLIHQAEGGTIFLDEIDSLPMPAQAKLLRFLQQREYRRLGSARARQADVRVISASNTNLPEAVRSGHFRQDLYFRLSVLPLRLPPLRERPEDILLLANHILLRHGATFAATASRPSGRVAFNRHANALTPSAIKKLLDYDWPDRKARAVYEMEHLFLKEILEKHGANITQAARAAQIERRTFFGLLQKHKLTKNSSLDEGAQPNLVG